MPGPISIFKYLVYFSISFVVLSCPIGQGTLFQVIYSKTKHITSPVYANIASTGRRMIDSITDYSSQVFSNAKPKVDFIDLKSSALERGPMSNVDDQDFAPESSVDSSSDSSPEFSPEEAAKIKSHLKEESESSSLRDN